MTTDAAHEFWLSDQYTELARVFEQNIEITKPRSGYTCDVLPSSTHCSWCASNVTYYEYNGPSV